jgi:hypothetical protein
MFLYPTQSSTWTSRNLESRKSSQLTRAPIVGGELSEEKEDFEHDATLLKLSSSDALVNTNHVQLLHPLQRPPTAKTNSWSQSREAAGSRDTRAAKRMAGCMISSISRLHSSSMTKLTRGTNAIFFASSSNNCGGRPPAGASSSSCTEMGKDMVEMEGSNVRDSTSSIVDG